MIISDLNYLEAVSPETEIIGGFTFNKNLNSNVNTNANLNLTSNVNDTFNKTASITVRSNVTGNSSTLAFDNEAAGRNSNTQGSLNQLAVAGQGSSQNGVFVAAAN